MQINSKFTCLQFNMKVYFDIFKGAMVVIRLTRGGRIRDLFIISSRRNPASREMGVL